MNILNSRSNEKTVFVLEGYKVQVSVPLVAALYLKFAVETHIWATGDT